MVLDRRSILMFISPLNLPFFFFSNKLFRQRFLRNCCTLDIEISISIGSALSYCVRENHAYHSLYLYFFFSFSPMNIFVTDFSASKGVRVFKVCLYLQSVEVSCVKENHNAEISFDFTFFPSLILSVMQSEICVKYFSGTTERRILKFSKKHWV